MIVYHHHPEILSTHRSALHTDPSSNLLRNLSEKAATSGFLQGSHEGADSKGPYRDLFLLRTEGFLEVLMLLEKRFHTIQGISQVFVQQESLAKGNKVFRRMSCSFQPLRKESKGCFGQNTDKKASDSWVIKLLRPLPEIPEPFRFP